MTTRLFFASTWIHKADPVRKFPALCAGRRCNGDLTRADDLATGCNEFAHCWLLQDIQFVPADLNQRLIGDGQLIFAQAFFPASSKYRSMNRE